ncbi:MAG: acylphosphatase [Hyphomicrobiaceae bacterium]
MTRESDGIRTVHVRIEGRVHGVGFRAWTEQIALDLQLDGWVRNRRDGTVEALFSGDPDAVSEMLRCCETGPPAARVVRVVVLGEGGGIPRGFEVKPTV